MSTRRRARDAAIDAGLLRFNLFVPAVMSVGLLFWVVTELIELFRARADEARDDHAKVAAMAVVDETLDRRETSSPSARGERPRAAYLMIGVTLVAAAIYVMVGSIANYLRPEGYVSDIASLLALALIGCLIGLFYGVASLTAAWTWSSPPRWVRGMILRSPLGTKPLEGPAPPGRPSWWLGVAVVAAASLAALIGLAVGWSPHLVDGFDEGIADWLTSREVFSAFTVLDPVGSSEIALAIALLAGLAAVRCRVLAAGYAMATMVALFLSLVIRPLAAHPRPPWGPLVGDLDSFPSGHVLFGVLFAGLLPLAIAVLLDRTWIIAPLRLALGTGVAASAIHRIAVGVEWPSDVLGGALIGLMLVLAVQWSVDNAASHRACHHCPWCADPHHGPVIGAIPIHPTAHGALRLGAHLSAAAAALALTFLTVAVDLPVDADGYTLGRSAEWAIQLVLALLLTTGALLAWRWEGLAALFIAFGAAGTGIFAAVEYPPAVAVALTVALMIPAVLLWLSWQHRRLPHEIVALALATTVLLGAAAAGANSVHDHYYGPTHPDSVAPDIGRDRVVWVWAGGLRPDRVVITARLVEGHESARMEVEPRGGPRILTDTEEPDRFGTVRFDIDGLAPDTEYRYRLSVDDDEDEGRGHGRFRTPAEGPTSFTLTAAACARTSSNGAVFDAIRAEDPLLHLALGDLHYENIESTDERPYLDAFRRALTTPAQAALARDVPMAYVWDDHDYGPNDADASNPGRAAARAAYRRAVPHYGVPPGDAPINQAFTIGRVRVVVTDTRSERTDDTQLGATQKAWLIDELTRGSVSHAVVLWVNPVPWIATPRDGSDGWAGNSEERAEIADAVAVAGIDNLVMVSGDAHMVAIDDGSHSDYSSSGGAGFPVLHAAALDRPGNVKGGPYSEGAFAGTGQYGVIEVVDDGGDQVRVLLRGRTWEGRTLVSYEHTVDVG